MPAADIEYTYANVERAKDLLDYAPKVTVEQGVEAFWDWYQSAVLGSGAP
jgi:nucleoside-diphosphate-sugar epimerase